MEKPSRLQAKQSVSHPGDTDLQSTYDIEAVANLNSGNVSFEIRSACPSDYSDADYLRCAKTNIPTLTPEIYLLIGDSPKIPEEYESDLRQVLDWLIDMGLGYDRYVHIVYELDGGNEESLRTLAQLGLLIKGGTPYDDQPVSDISHIHDQRSCLSAFWGYAPDDQKRKYNFCIQPNRLTDPRLEFDRLNNYDQFYYERLLGNLLHEYCHHVQRAHTLDLHMGNIGDCCGIDTAVEAPPFWIEGAAVVFPHMFTKEKFYEFDYTKRNGLTDDSVLIDRVGYYRKQKQKVQEEGGRCYLGSRDGVGLDGVVRQPQCDWGMAAYYLAYNASHQIMWVDIPRDMWSMGFPAAFQKHVGLTVDEFAESYSNFMSSGSPDDPPPEGFYTEKPLSELVDFWSLKTNPSGIPQ